MGLSAVGLALSAYLGWHYLAGGAVIGCGGGSPCDRVLSSRWSSVGGVLPVSGLAAGAYLAMLMASFFVGSATESPVRRLAWRAMLVLVGAVAGSAVWFVIVQKWIIGSFCPYCMVTHINGVLLATLIIWQAPKQSEAGSTESEPATSASTPTPQRIVGRLPAMGFALTGVGLAGIMVICQATITPPPASRGGEAKENLPAIDFRNAPMVGSPDARYIVNLLFDYNCPHCQELHFMLNEVVRRYHGKLAFVLCPTPLNTQCNPYIPRDVDEFKDSCELAKVALTVWVAKREAFPAFELWMFSLESGDRWRPRSLDAARAKAIEMVGQAKFDAAVADAWIDQYLRASIRIYGNTTQSGNNAVPKLVFGSRWVIPQPNHADDLVLILHDRLAVPGPDPSVAHPPARQL
jgi:uncharacterized membrane protein/protein-disulfide isomerase